MKKDCPICKKEFNTKDKRSKYCSFDCYIETRKGKPGPMLGKTPWNKGNRAYEVVCKYCGDVTYRSLPAQYCSKACFDKSPEKKETCRKNGSSLKGKAKKPFHLSWGYKYIFTPNHPMADSHGYVAEHRLKMSEFLKRHLSENEVVHHINGNKFDNRIENLEVVDRKTHAILHLSIRDELGQFANYGKRCN